MSGTLTGTPLAKTTPDQVRQDPVSIFEARSGTALTKNRVAMFDLLNGTAPRATNNDLHDVNSGRRTLIVPSTGAGQTNGGCFAVVPTDHAAGDETIPEAVIIGEVDIEASGTVTKGRLVEIGGDGRIVDAGVYTSGTSASGVIVGQALTAATAGNTARVLFDGRFCLPDRIGTS